MLPIQVQRPSHLPHVIRNDGLVDDRKAARFGTCLDIPLSMPALLLGLRLLECLEAVGGQAGLDLLTDGAESAEGSQRVGLVVCAERALGVVVVGDGGDARGRGLKVGVRDQEVARDVGAQRREDL